jgi:hypothetical protein
MTNAGRGIAGAPITCPPQRTVPGAQASNCQRVACASSTKIGGGGGTAPAGIEASSAAAAGPGSRIFMGWSLWLAHDRRKTEWIRFGSNRIGACCGMARFFPSSPDPPQAGQEIGYAKPGRWMKRAVFLAFALLLLAGCDRGPPPPPIAVYLEENGKPVSWKPHDRLRVEGRISRTSGGDYLITTTTGSGEDVTRNCLLMRDPDNGWSVRWLQAMLLADSGKLVAVTGRSTEDWLELPTPGDGDRQSRMCVADVVMDGLTVL